MLPKDWQICEFGEVTTIGSGLVDPRNTQYKSMLHIGPEDMESTTGRILSPKTCAELGLISGKYEFDEKAVIYSKIRPHLNKVCFPKFKGVCSADAYPIWPDCKRLLPEYLKLYMLGPVFEKRAVACSMRTGMPKINREDLQAIHISFPSVKEQEIISSVLNTWDKSVFITQQLIINSRKQKLALLAKTLHSAPAINDTTKKSDNGGFSLSVQPGIPNLEAVPAGWQRIQLGDHLQEVRRPVALAKDLQYTLVTVKRSRGGVQKREVLFGDEIKTSTQFFVKEGDFLISKRQIVHGACGIVPPELDGAVVSNEYAILNSDGKIDLNFLRYLSETKYFQQTCFHSSIGVHVEKMIFKTDRWLTWPFNIPPLDEQKRIVEILNLAMKEINLLEAELTRLKQEKSALMSQLLTGKRRLRLPDTYTDTTPTTRATA